MKKWVLIISGVIALAIHLNAVEIKIDDRIQLERTYTENVIAMGDQIDVTSKFGGSAWLFGSTIDFAGEVQEDIYCFSGEMVLNGYIWQNVWVFGGDITLDGTMRGDVHVFGGSVQVLKDAVIKGDLTVWSGELIIDGRIDGNVNIKSEKVAVNGIINNDIKIESKEVDISSTAIIVGDLIRLKWNNSDEDWPAIRGNVYNVRPYSHQRITLGFFLSSLLIGLIWYKLFPRSLSCTGKQLIDKPGMVTLWGLFYIFIMPIIFVILLLGVFTIPVAFLLIIFYSFSFFLGQYPTAIWLGNFIGRHSTAFNKRYLPLVTGMMLLYLLLLIPGIKVLVMIFWGITGFGSIWYYLINMRRQRKAVFHPETISVAPSPLE